MSDASKRKEKQTWAIEKPILDNARELRGIFFIELVEEEIKFMMKMLVESWKFRYGQRCLADFNFMSTGRQDEVCCYC